MSAPDIPTNYTVNTHLGGGLDLDLDNIRIKELPTITLNTAVTDLPVIRTVSEVNLGLDNLRIKEIPRIDLQLGIRPTRVHLPVGLKFGVSVLGCTLFSFDICGESMVVIEDYKPHETEECT